jgi:FRG domain
MVPRMTPESRSLVADSVKEFTGIIAERRKKWTGESKDAVLWYRGHTDKSWELLPKFYREVENPTIHEEDEIREQFVIRAPHLTNEKPQNEWEWYFLMQHYGAPTRLLDWTDGALIALYFAVKDNPGYYDAAVWFLDPWAMNWRFHRMDEVLPPGSSSGLWTKDIRRYRKWLHDRFESKARFARFPVAVFPTHFARRLSTQRSCFTVHGSDHKPLEKLYSKRGARLQRIIIPAEVTADIREQLLSCGIDEVTIYPDLDGLGRAIRAEWRSESDALPHTAVCTRLGPSKLHKKGVGVFAIKRIRKGNLLFPGDSSEARWIKAGDLPKRPAAVRKLYEDFSVVKNGRYLCPVSFDRLTPSWYLNDSDNPNVCCVDGYDFRAIRNIEPGEELSVDSSTYSQHEPFTLDRPGRGSSKHRNRSRA